MTRYILSRLGYMIFTFLLIASLTFFLMQTLPGSPFNDERLSEAQEKILNQRYGLDEPVAMQYFKYLGNVLVGELGVSFQFDGRSVTTIIGERIGVSAILGAQAMGLGLVLGGLLGIIAAVRHNTFMDYTAMIIAVLGLSIPNFVFAGLLQYWVGVRLQWLPVAFWQGFEYSILPTISLAAFVMATIARYMRSEMLDVLGQDYITTAHAKGVDRWKVIRKHGIRNAMIPIITIVGPLTVSLMTGTLVVEQIFSVPGLGEQFVNSILTNDYPVIMGVTLFFSLLFIAVIFVVDILYGIVDPRIRLSGGGRN
ncbi:oligopeptide ABC transporter permease [Salinicoccus halodurans]|uniref:Oligopeptide transport system permease protein n=1 Tax=Salinicoccus halodurans TaxID=407035 RepID=A0A0F7D4W8_9STAP|nr:oligopeptide ABC transporter permease [Salinicoccus halodurans]AKG74960.1 peptide ABC transporter permease [Salinicoccus halodurans]SFK67722.1 oligopeptide transport system permease protein [Salinicoccus halodurans]